MQPTTEELLEQIAQILATRQDMATWQAHLPGIRQNPRVRLLMAEEEALLERLVS